MFGTSLMQSLFETKGLFEKDIDLYTIGKQKYTIKDLTGLTHAEIKPIYNEFATILRGHAITDFEHSFYILVDLFLCKITDEMNNPDDLQFHYKGITRDTPKEYCSRLLKLYQQGKERLFHINVVNKDDADIRQIFEDNNRVTNGLYKGIKEMFDEVKFYNIKKFNFISVENREDFEANFQILIKVTSLIQDINLSDSETNHFFGTLFEGLLSKNVHQTEGQFFTPPPIVNFIIKCLPRFSTPDKVRLLDYACGAGHFLTEPCRIYPNIALYGIEKSQSLSQVAKIAAIINGSKDSHIIYKDALSLINPRDVRYHGFEPESFDCIIANPPYSVKGFLETLTDADRQQFELIRTVEEKSYANNDSIESFFVERAKHFLKKHGVFGIILPSSILSNAQSQLDMRTRELLFANFNLLSIVMMNNRTFGSTGTKTMILFAQKVKKNAEGLVGTLIGKKDITQYLSYEAVYRYCEMQGYNRNEFFDLMQNSVLSDTLCDNAVLVEYRTAFVPQPISKTMQKDWFEKSEFYETGMKGRTYNQALKRFVESPEYATNEQAEHERQFIAFVREIETDKLTTYVQVADNNVALLQSPPEKVNGKSNKDAIVSFLGYTWSNRKGDEGIRYVTDQQKARKKADDEDKDSEVLEALNSITHIKTPLYSPYTDDDSTKFCYAIRQHIMCSCSSFSFKVEPQAEEAPSLGEVGELFSITPLADMIDFSRAVFDKTIKTRATKRIEVKSKYRVVKLGDYAFVEKGQAITSAQCVSGNVKVVAGGRDFTCMHNVSNRPANVITISASGANAGYVNFWKEPIFASDCSTVLPKEDLPENERLLPGYIFAYLQMMQTELFALQTGSGQPHVYPDDIKMFPIPLPPTNTVQKQIVEECAKVDEAFETTRMSIEDYRKKIAQVFESLKVIGGG